MDSKKIRGRKYNETKKLCVGRNIVIGSILNKTANRIYQGSFIDGILIRGPNLLNNLRG